MQLWDIAGQDRFAKLTRSYFRKAKAAAIVCDLTRENTLEAVKQWKSELDKFALTEYEGSLPVVLFANKCDLLSDPTTSFIAGAKMEALCRDLGMVAWFVTSAKENVNVEEGFRLLAKTHVLNEIRERESRLSQVSSENVSKSRLKQRLQNRSVRAPLGELNSNKQINELNDKSSLPKRVEQDAIQWTSNRIVSKQNDESDSRLLDVWDVDDCE